MSNISMSDAELLKFAIENGILNEELVRQQIEMQRRKELLEKHPYEIYVGKDGNWYTYLPCEEGRKKVKAKTEALVQNKVVAFWREKVSNPCMEEMFHDWIDEKLFRNEIGRSTYDRYKIDFYRYFTDIQKKKIRSIDEMFLEDFIRDAIGKHCMTSKQFSNFRTLIYGLFKYAKRKRYINFSITYMIRDMDISARAFKKVAKRPDNEVYSLEEKKVMEEYLINNLDIINLGLLLTFKTGLRVGELSTLKVEDVKDYTIFVNRTETKFRDENGKMTYGIKDFPKSEAGVRFAIIPYQYEWIIDKILELERVGEFLFEKNGRRIKTYSFRKRLRYICEAKIGMQVKSPHKIRKTYGTILLDGNVQESTILDAMGHTDIGCTKGHYYYGRKGIEEKRRELSGVVEL